MMKERPGMTKNIFHIKDVSSRSIFLHCYLFPQSYIGELEEHKLPLNTSLILTRILIS